MVESVKRRNTGTRSVNVNSDLRSRHFTLVIVEKVYEQYI